MASSMPVIVATLPSCEECGMVLPLTSRSSAKVLPFTFCPDRMISVYCSFWKRPLYTIQGEARFDCCAAEVSG